MITLANLYATGTNVDATCSKLASMAKAGDKQAAANLISLDREIRAERATMKAARGLDPEHRSILAKIFKGVPDTKSTLRATSRGTEFFMPMQTPTREQAKAALVEIEAELKALHDEMGKR